MTVDERRLGKYEVPVQPMEKEAVDAVLNPVARLVPGADGAVDLGLSPAYDDIASLYRDVLDLTGFGNGEFTADIETWRLVEVGQACLDWLDGKILTGPGDEALMPGSGRQPEGLSPRTRCAGR